MSTPRPAYPVLVLGSDSAPPEVVAAKLDVLLAPKTPDHLICVVVRGDEGHHAALWAHAGDYRCVWVEPELRGRGEPARWAMRVASLAAAVVIFGDERRWWRVVRYAAELGTPVRRVAAPAGYVAPERPERRVPWTFDVAADPLAQPPVRLDGEGPGGWPD